MHRNIHVLILNHQRSPLQRFWVLVFLLPPSKDLVLYFRIWCTHAYVHVQRHTWSQQRSDAVMLTWTSICSAAPERLWFALKWVDLSGTPPLPLCHMWSQCLYPALHWGGWEGDERRSGGRRQEGGEEIRRDSRSREEQRRWGRRGVKRKEWICNDNERKRWKEGDESREAESELCMMKEERLQTHKHSLSCGHTNTKVKEKETNFNSSQLYYHIFETGTNMTFKH